jgi:hypothetical protein
MDPESYFIYKDIPSVVFLKYIMCLFTEMKND